MGVLTLTRRLGERIQIGDDICVVVREVRRGQVKLAVQAPRSWAVYRGELYDAIQAENRAAAQADHQDLAAALGRMQAAPLATVAPRARGPGGFRSRRSDPAETTGNAAPGSSGPMGPDGPDRSDRKDER